MIEASDSFDERGLHKFASEMDGMIEKIADEGVNPAIFDELEESVEEGDTFEEASEDVEEEVPGWDLSEEDYQEMKEEEE